MNRLPKGRQARRRRYSTSAVSTLKNRLYGSNEKKPPLEAGWLPPPGGGRSGSLEKSGGGTLPGGGGNLVAARQGRDSGVALFRAVRGDTHLWWRGRCCRWLADTQGCVLAAHGRACQRAVVLPGDSMTSPRALESQLLLRGLRL